ncbi:MAG TPA: TolC family protein [Bryobacteraceae bacterium]|nr:TolC family protein [Bryobacteraceae bacterium]
MRVFVGTVTVMAATLTGCVHYRARTFSAPALEDSFRARSLVDTGLVEYLRANQAGVTNWPPSGLDVRTLALVGYYFNPELTVARARLITAEAAVRVAGIRPSPSVALEGGYNRNPESHPTYSILPSFTIETAGKRGLRIVQAQQQMEAARAAFLQTGWVVRSRIRGAVYSYLLAERRQKLLEAEVVVRTEVVDIYETRLAAGEAPRPELDIYRVDLNTARSSLGAALGDTAQSRVAIANAVGLPAAALEDITIQTPELDSPPALDSLPIAAVRKAGILHRADVRRALAEYAAADAAVRLEVAKQYPDVQLTPSYQFQEGFGEYILNAALQPLSLYRSRPIIQQAEAEREQAASQFQLQQTQAIGEMERAVAQYQSAFKAWRDAGSRVLIIQREREAAARRALEAGEGDRLGVATARLETITASRTELEALTRVVTALIALEDAMQQPMTAALQIGDPPTGTSPSGSSK